MVGDQDHGPAVEEVADGMRKQVLRHSRIDSSKWIIEQDDRSCNKGCRVKGKGNERAE